MEIVILEYPNNAYGFKDNPVIGFITNGTKKYSKGHIFIPSAILPNNTIEPGKIVPWFISYQDYKNIEVL